MLSRSSIALCAVAATLALAQAARAQSPPEVLGPYDGSIPFRCELQNVGTGTEFPDPEADPFCVEFDKTSQNVTDLGLVDFLAREPARVAAAATKCFYFQRDHWTGSVVQGEAPELWHWDGDYWFDRARGVGGVSARNLRFGGTPFDATPFAPPAFAPYLDPGGGGGVMVELETNPDPICAARVDTPAERDEIYADRALATGCVEPGGRLRGRRVGPVRLGEERERLLAKLGPPQRARKRSDRWCLVGKGELRVAYDEDGRVGAALSSGRGHALGGVARGDRAQRAGRRLEQRPFGRRGGLRALAVTAQRRRRAWIAVQRGRVRWVGIAAPGFALGPERLLRLASRIR